MYASLFLRSEYRLVVSDGILKSETVIDLEEITKINPSENLNFQWESGREKKGC